MAIRDKLGEFYYLINKNGFGGEPLSSQRLRHSLKNYFSVTERTVDSYLKESVRFGFIRAGSVGWVVRKIG